MKLGKEPSARSRQPKAAEFLQHREDEDLVAFDPDRDLGEAFRKGLLVKAEQYLQDTENEEVDEPEPFRAFPFLAAHKLLFSRYRAELDAVMNKYKVKEEVMDAPEAGMSFMEKMILSPEQKETFARQADSHIKSMRGFSTGAGMPVELLISNVVQMASVKPELLGEFRLPAKKGEIFSLLKREYSSRDWAELIVLASRVRLLFPEEFTASLFTQNDWKEMVQTVKNSNSPELALHLGILAAEQVDFLPEGEVRLTWQTRGLQSKLDLPPRHQL